MLGVVLFYRGFRMLQYKRLILNTPFSKIRSASMGLVEVSGMATGPQTIPAGITGEACYYYRAIAWELRSSGNQRQWRKVADESLFVPFFVEDPTGKMLVDPQGADMDVHRSFKDEFDSSILSGRDVLPENVTLFMVRNGVSLSRTIRLEEHCIQPGYPLFILGTLGENPNHGDRVAATHVASASSSIRSRAGNSFPIANALFRFVAGGSGSGFGASPEKVSVAGARIYSAIAAPKCAAAAPPAVPAASNWSSISMDEVHPPGSVPSAPEASANLSQIPAAATVATADAPVAPPAETQQAEEFALDAPAAIGKGTGSDPFTISSQSQREVVRSLGWKSALCIWGGPILTLICLYILFGMAD